MVGGGEGPAPNRGIYPPDLKPYCNTTLLSRHGLPSSPRMQIAALWSPRQAPLLTPFREMTKLRCLPCMHDQKQIRCIREYLPPETSKYENSIAMFCYTSFLASARDLRAVKRKWRLSAAAVCKHGVDGGGGGENNCGESTDSRLSSRKSITSLGEEERGRKHR